MPRVGTAGQCEPHRDGQDLVLTLRSDNQAGKCRIYTENGNSGQNQSHESIFQLTQGLRRAECISLGTERPAWKSQHLTLVLGTGGFPGGSDGKASACNVGDLGLIPELGKSLEKEMAAHSTILAWKIPWMEEPGRLQSMGLQRVGHE